MKPTHITLIAIICLSSCNSQNRALTPEVITSDDSASMRKGQFSAFLSKFRILKNETFKIEPTGHDTSLVALDQGSADTLFIPYSAMGLAYGILPDTSKLYALLWYAAVEAGQLTITTIDKNGNRRDEKSLSTDSAYWDCGHQWFGQVFIKNDMTILLRDSVTIFNCDTGVPPEIFWKHELDSTDVIINQMGKIFFSKTRKTKLD